MTEFQILLMQAWVARYKRYATQCARCDELLRDCRCHATDSPPVEATDPW